MNATGKSRFTERILRIAGITPKRATRPNLLLLFLLPLAFGLLSWDRSETQREPEETRDFTTVSDTTPPQLRMPVDPNKAQPREEPSAAPAKDLGDFADDIGKVVTNQRVIVNNEPDVPESIAIEVVKMNVLYIGVDNPLRIAAAGVPAEELQVELIGEGSISGSGGNYIVNVLRPGEVKVRVKRKVGEEIKFLVDQKYRVKRIPDPRPLLNGRYHHAKILPETLQESRGIFMVLENFDFDAHCEVLSFEVTYLPKVGAPISIMNQGQEWNAQVKEMFARAKSGDTYFFDNIKCKCPGDAAARDVGGMVFKIITGEE